MKQLPHGLDIILASPLYSDINAENFIKQLQLPDLKCSIHYAHFEGCMYSYNSDQEDSWGWIEIDGVDQLMDLGWMMMDDYGDLVPMSTGTHGVDDQIDAAIWLYFGAGFDYSPVSSDFLEWVSFSPRLKTAQVVDSDLAVWLIYPSKVYGEWNAHLEKQPPFKTLTKTDVIITAAQLCDGSWSSLNPHY